MGSLIAAVALCASVGCGEDDDASPTVTTGAGTNQGNSGTSGSLTSVGTPTGTATTTGAEGATTGAGGMTSAGAGTSTGTGATGAATGAGVDTGTGVTTGGTTAGAAPDAGAAGADAGAAGADAGAAGADAGAALAAAAEDLTDGQMLFAVDTVNAGEVDQSRAALPGLEDEAARRYAQLMIEEHEPARDRLLVLAEAEDIPLEASEVATQLREKSEQIILSLLAVSGDELEQAYIESQVTAHGAALQLIDAMIPAADSDAVDAELTQLRASVAGHLEAAEELLDAASE